MRIVFIVCIGVFLTACNTLPSRVVPSSLEVQQRINKNAPPEYVFCDVKVGAWKCKEVTKKTKYQKPVPEPIKSEKLSISKEASESVFDGKEYQVLDAIRRENKPDGIVYFDFDSSVLKGESKQKINDLLLDQVEKEEVNVLVVGYTDRAGTLAYNKKLALKRAESVANFINTDEVFNAVLFKGKGGCCYIDAETTEKEGELSRRVEIFLYENETKKQ